MDITIRELMEMDSFKDAILVAGFDGINNKINHINAMEIPDITSWLSEGELLITTGYAIKNQKEYLNKLIVGLYEAKSAGLAIKTKFIGPIDNEIRDLANRYKIPIIVVGDDVSFVSMTTPIIKRLVDKQKKIRRYYQEIHDIFIDLELNGGNIEDIVSMIYTLTNKSVLILDIKFNTLACVDFKKEDINNIKDNFNKLKLDNIHKVVEEVEIGENKYLVRRIIYKNNICGLIVLKLDSNYDKLLNIVLDHASTVIALEFSKKEAIIEYNITLDNMFFVDIMSGNIKNNRELIVRAESLNWAKPPYIPIYFDIENFSSYSKEYNELELYNLKIDIVNIMRLEFMDIGDKNKIFLKSDNFSCLLQIKNMEVDFMSNLDRKIEKIIKKVNLKYRMNIFVGVGNNIEQLSDLKVEFENAKKAMILCRKLKIEKRYSHIKDLHFQNAILESSSKIYFEMYSSSKLEVLYKYDEENNSDLLNTLKSYIYNGCNTIATSKDLYLHRNTVSYRLNQIEKILEVDLGDYSEIIDLAIAFKINEVIRL